MADAVGELAAFCGAATEVFTDAEEAQMLGKFQQLAAAAVATCPSLGLRLGQLGWRGNGFKAGHSVEPQQLHRLAKELAQLPGLDRDASVERIRSCNMAFRSQIEVQLPDELVLRQAKIKVGTAFLSVARWLACTGRSSLTD